MEPWEGSKLSQLGGRANLIFQGLNWIGELLADKIRELDPDMAEKQEDILNDISPLLRTFGPFGGMTVNYGGITNLHWDTEDHGLCAIVPFSHGSDRSHFIGADLCLLELKMRFKVEEGEAILFRSAEIGHCNMPCTGWRGSIVCHTDRHLSRFELSDLFDGYKDSLTSASK